MRISQLGLASGVPVATIKYYQREKLLPAGDGAGRSDYGDAHGARLRLIRALIDVGGLSVASCAAVLEKIDSDAPLPETFEVAQHVVSDPVDESQIDPDALDRIDEALAGWHVSPGNPGRLSAARVLTNFTAVGQADERGWVARYAEAALIIAAADLDEVDARATREAKAETVVVGTVLGDALISGLRRAAQEHMTSIAFSSPEES